MYVLTRAFAFNFLTSFRYGENKLQMSLEDRQVWNHPGVQRNYCYASYALSLPSALMGTQLGAGLGLSVNGVPHASSSTTQASECSSSIKNYCYRNNCSTLNWISCCKLQARPLGKSVSPHVVLLVSGMNAEITSTHIKLILVYLLWWKIYFNSRELHFSFSHRQLKLYPTTILLHYTDVNGGR